MTKTEQQLLSELKAKGRVGCEWIHGRGPEGGRINEGYRRFHALRKLIASGCAVLVEEYRSDDFEGCRTSLIVAELNPN